jgi:hypothetical protein
MAVLREHYWAGGYCSAACARADDEGAERDLPDPDDRRALLDDLRRNLDFMDAMQEAACINKRLPKIIYLRRQGKTLREIAKAVRCSNPHVARLLQQVAPNILRACGLQQK